MGASTAGPDSVPEFIDPMRATAQDHLPEGEGWAYEIKWDGVRTVAFIGAGGVRLQSRSGRDVTGHYPEATELTGVGTGTVLDGEIVAFDQDDRPSFERLQSRINLGSVREVSLRRVEVPVAFVLFDLLYLEGHNLMGLPYAERRSQLEALALAGPSLQVPRHHRGDGAALLEATRQRGLEGLVAKRLDSTYQPGRRSRNWIKVKNFRRQELVVGGWLPGQAGRNGRIGALLVGHYHQGQLRYAGRVGTGFTDAELVRLADLLAPLARADSPFSADPALPAPTRRLGRWVEPALVIEVAFSEWTVRGTLRAPAYKGERFDRDPATVVRET